MGRLGGMQGRLVLQTFGNNLSQAMRALILSTPAGFLGLSKGRPRIVQFETSCCGFILVVFELGALGEFDERERDSQRPVEG